MSSSGKCFNRGTMPIDISNREMKRPKSANGRGETERAIIDVNSVVSGRNYAILTSIIAHLMTSRPFPGLCRRGERERDLCPNDLCPNPSKPERDRERERERERGSREREREQRAELVRDPDLKNAIIQVFCTTYVQTWLSDVTHYARHVRRPCVRSSPPPPPPPPSIARGGLRQTPSYLNASKIHQTQPNRKLDFLLIWCCHGNSPVRSKWGWSGLNKLQHEILLQVTGGMSSLLTLGIAVFRFVWVWNVCVLFILHFSSGCGSDNSCPSSTDSSGNVLMKKTCVCVIGLVFMENFQNNLWWNSIVGIVGMVIFDFFISKTNNIGGYVYLVLQ